MLQLAASSKKNNFVSPRTVCSSTETYLHKVMQQLHKLQYGNKQTCFTLIAHKKLMASFHSYLG